MAVKPDRGLFGRRDFLARGGLLALAGASLGGLAVGLRSLWPRRGRRILLPVPAGRPDEYPVGQVSGRLVQEHEVWLVRSLEGFVAFAAACTHLGCRLRHHTPSGEFRCMCHGSAFSAGGEVLRGPSARPQPRRRRRAAGGPVGALPQGARRVGAAGRVRGLRRGQGAAGMSASDRNPGDPSNSDDTVNTINSSKTLDAAQLDLTAPETRTVQVDAGQGRGSSVLRSIFRHGWSDTPHNRIAAVTANLWLHLHPRRVPPQTLRFRFTLCAGGIAFLLFLVTLAVHLVRVLLTGSYKAPREFNWVVGVGLLVLTLAIAFTGYLLPYDQKGYWATTVGTHLAGAVPILGADGPGALVGQDTDLRAVLLGGSSLGPASLVRFYALHCFVLPLLCGALTALHFWRVRKDGISTPL